jgi:hypothetical protein
MWRDSLLCVVCLGKGAKGERVWVLGSVRVTVEGEGEGEGELGRTG